MRDGRDVHLRTVSLTRISRVSIALTAAAAALTLLVGIGDPASIVAGGAFMLADFHLIRMLVSRLITPGMSQAWTVVLLTLKFLLAVALIAGVMYQFPIAPMSFAFGASLLMVAVVLDAVLLGEEVPALEPGDTADVKG